MRIGKTSIFDEIEYQLNYTKNNDPLFQIFELLHSVYEKAEKNHSLPKSLSPNIDKTKNESEPWRLMWSK